MGVEYKDIILSPRRDRRFIVLSAILYKDVIVPEGYSTNGADIPRVFWTVIPPNDTSILPAVIIHDYLCAIEEYEKADDYFEEILIALEIARWKRVVLVGAVRLYHYWKGGIKNE